MKNALLKNRLKMSLMQSFEGMTVLLAILLVIRYLYMEIPLSLILFLVFDFGFIWFMVSILLCPTELRTTGYITVNERENGDVDIDVSLSSKDLEKKKDGGIIKLLVNKSGEDYVN